MKLQLWLDESGTFERDDLREEVPSIIGGVMTAQLDTKGAEAIIDASRAKLTGPSGIIHGTEISAREYGGFAIDLLGRVVDSGARLVMFENQERVKVVDGDLTYLNLLAEGVVQLFGQLQNQYGDVEVEIFAARRHHRAKMARHNNGLYLIEEEEYTRRIKEKVSLALIRKSLDLGPGFTWTFRLGSAKRDPELQIADVVCHSWFRRESNKFNDAQRQQLQELYSPTDYFSVIEAGAWSAIQRYLSQGAIGMAIFEWLTSDTLTKEADFPHLAAPRIQRLDPSILEAELLNLLNRIKLLIKVDRALDRAGAYLERLRTELLPLLPQDNLGNFKFEISFLLLTQATHQGDLVRAQELIDKCDGYLPQLAGRWEGIGTYFNYRIRAAIHDMNTYNFAKVIQDMDRMDKTLEDTLGLFALADDLAQISSGMKSDLRGKVLGTRFQARIFRVRFNPQEVQLAREDFDSAVAEFAADPDKKRQYQYRAQLECEAGNFQESLAWLGKSFGLEWDWAPETVLTGISGGKAEVVFGLMHYTRLMAAAALERHPLAGELYQAWVKQGKDQLDHQAVHPYQVISWKLGTYLARQSNFKAALKRYDTALEICLQGSSRLALTSIGCAIALEKAALLHEGGAKVAKEARTATGQAIKYVEGFLSQDMPEEMRVYFNDWQQVVHLAKLEQPAGELLGLSRLVPY